MLRSQCTHSDILQQEDVIGQQSHGSTHLHFVVAALVAQGIGGSTVAVTVGPVAR